MGLVLVIVGPTASGKSGLAVEVAKKHNGEVISADSRALYQHVSIAAAVPTAVEQAGIPHWGLNLVGPKDFNYNKSGVVEKTPFNAAAYKKYAENKIEDIHRRGKLPIVVGGSGLYVDALIYDYSFVKNTTSRKVLDDDDRETLASKHQYIVVGITTTKEELEQRIKARALQMLEQGLIDEYKNARHIYPKNSEILKSNAFIALDSVGVKAPLQDVVAEITRLDKKLVKKQNTWFKRNEQIEWVSLPVAAMRIDQLLSAPKG